MSPGLRFCVVLGSVAWVFSAGCGGGSGDVKLSQGHGTVTYKGSPLAGASVTRPGRWSFGYSPDRSIRQFQTLDRRITGSCSGEVRCHSDCLRRGSSPQASRFDGTSSA